MLNVNTLCYRIEIPHVALLRQKHVGHFIETEVHLQQTDRT